MYNVCILLKNGLVGNVFLILASTLENMDYCTYKDDLHAEEARIKNGTPLSVRCTACSIRNSGVHRQRSRA